MYIWALYFIGLMGIVTYILELWTGCAIAGWAGDKAIVQREKSPGPYWAVMALQTAILIAGVLLLV